jgi:hypothetical protein
MGLALATDARSGPGATGLRSFHCSGCGRRLFEYAADTLGRDAVIRVRCRDCKTTSELRGADVAALLHALSHGKGVAS